MIKFRFALDQDEQVVDVMQLALDRHAGPFHCVGCGEPLTAKIRGERKARHFSHRRELECGQETYLHRLGKKVFDSVYRACLGNGEPFLLRLKHPLTCTRHHGLLGETCYCGSQDAIHDLTRYYNDVLVEVRDGEFIPDLVLFHRERPERRIYVEIAVSHFLSPKKRDSGRRIIEIPVSCEDDVEPIRQRLLTEPEVGCYNLVRRPLPAPECACDTRTFYALFVYRSGKSFAGAAPLVELEAQQRQYGSSIAYHRVVDAERFIPSPFHLFRELSADALDAGIEFRSCFLCRHAESPRSQGADTAVYCRWFRRLVRCGRAADCPVYQQYLPVPPAPVDPGSAAAPSDVSTEPCAPTAASPEPATPLAPAVEHLSAGMRLHDSADAGPGDITLDTLRRKWDAVLENLDSRSHRLTALLRGARVLRVSRRVVTIEFAEWHQQSRADEPSTMRMLEAAFREVLGVPVKISAVLYDPPGEPA